MIFCIIHFFVLFRLSLTEIHMINIGPYYKYRTYIDMINSEKSTERTEIILNKMISIIPIAIVYLFTSSLYDIHVCIHCFFQLMIFSLFLKLRISKSLGGMNEVCYSKQHLWSQHLLYLEQDYTLLGY